MKLIGFWLVGYLLIGSPAHAADCALAGSWTTTIQTAQGPVSSKWDIAPDGGYHVVINGPVPEEWGKLFTDNGKWGKISTNGIKDFGTYTLNATDSFTITNRMNHTFVFRRVSQSAISTEHNAQPEINRNISDSSTPSLSTVETKATAIPKATAIGQVVQRVLPTAAAALGNTKLAPYVRAAQAIAGGGVAQGMGMSVHPLAGSNVFNSGVFGSSASGSGTGLGSVPSGSVGVGRLISRITSAASSGALAGADVKTLLLSDFPLPKGRDEAEQFTIREIGQVATGGMQVRKYRVIK